MQLVRRVLWRSQRYIDTRLAPRLDGFLYFISPGVVALGFGLCLALTYIGVLVILPLKNPSPAASVMHLAAAAVLIGNMLVRYVLCVVTDPGIVPTCTAYKQLIKTLPHVEASDVEGAAGPALWNKCRHTGILRPPRCKYCQVLRCNVLNFDRAFMLRRGARTGVAWQRG